MATPPLYHNHINGAWVPARSGETLANRNPANLEEVVGLFPKSGASDVEAAVAAAAEAYRSWRLVPAPKRAELLYRLGQYLMEHKEDFARDMTREMGKVLAEARGDVQEAIDTCFFGAGEGRRLHGETTPSEMPNKFMMSVRQPIGVAGLITPWNFPMAIPSWKMIPALVCGNTVVLKPASDTPLSSTNLVKACEAVGFPPGVVNLVTGGGGVVGNALLAHPAVGVVSFTGSTEVGRHLAVACAERNKRLSLEMGGKNILMVMEDANLDLAVEGAVWGGFGTTGQRCTAASRVVVHRNVEAPFLERFAAKTRMLKIGNGLDETVQVGPLISSAQRDTVEDYVRIGQEEGARLICGGKRVASGDCAGGAFHEPTIFAGVTRKMRIAQEEIFGPVVSVLSCADLDEAIDIANDSQYGLSAAIYTQDVNRAFTAMRDVFTGIFYVNHATIGAEVHLPFGGTKATGNGHREAGHQVLDVFSEWKSVYVDFSGKLQRAQIDNN
ncbi:MAG: aldehyde dehydrogenase family protein [Acidobacteriota bacterium]